MKSTLTRIPANFVNVRAAADTHAAILATLHAGDVVTLAAPIVTGDWVELTTAAGVQGFVSQQGGAVQFTAVPEKPPIPAVILGLDVSQAQAVVDWQRVKAAGLEYAMIRATQGIAASLPVGVDTRFVTHITGALAANLRVGAYHNFIATRDGKAQAEFFYGVVAPYFAHISIPLAVDVEGDYGQPPSAIADRLHSMTVALEGLSGQKPMLYTSPGFWNKFVGDQHDAYFSTLPVWVAAWTSAPQPVTPRPWKHVPWAMWQYSNKGEVDGIKGHTDLDRAHK